MSSTKAMKADQSDSASDPVCRAREEARDSRTFGPRSLKCCGVPLFRNQLARDMSMLLDVDPEVETWRCLPAVLAEADNTPAEHASDFAVHYANGVTKYVDVVGGEAEPVSFDGDAVTRQAVSAFEIRAEPRFTNARDLLRYVSAKVTLSDRVKLLAILDEQGPIPIGDVLRSYRSSADPIAVIASLFLHRHISIDIDGGIIGPETVIQRRRS